MNQNYKIIEMRLHSEPFEKIKNGTKQIEMRLFDEKRSLINLGDTIIFSERDNSQNKLEARVVGLCRFSNFEDLLKSLDPIECGYESVDDIKSMADEMLVYYSQEEQEKYGVLGICFELI
jgi:ASC-1-like (ASCH) protein